MHFSPFICVFHSRQQWYSHISKTTGISFCSWFFAMYIVMMIYMFISSSFRSPHCFVVQSHLANPFLFICLCLFLSFASLLICVAWVSCCLLSSLIFACNRPSPHPPACLSVPSVWCLSVSSPCPSRLCFGNQWHHVYSYLRSGAMKGTRERETKTN